jgi:hypothetical protein
VFPRPVAVLRQPCARCGVATRVDRLIQGFGSDCAAKLGLTVAITRLRSTVQDGPDLLDVLAAEPEDECDGWDR